MPSMPETRDSAELEQHSYPKGFNKAQMAAKLFVPIEGSSRTKVTTMTLNNIDETVDRDVSLSVLEDILSLQKNQVYLLSYIDIDYGTSPYFANEFRVS
ncbi:hypothetical protein [Vagococcus bubulae]|uniref:hypothetical protein n=1 Tax=Vagococcus bubulae TaxID=1977868 RepID=UPI0022E1C394|nr:hypothetical protein [Vagococcus bubulae]